MTTLWQQLNQDISDTIEGASRSLVQVRDGRRGAGAGTIWHADGLVLTNAHVVRGQRPTVVLANGRELPARVLALDAKHDLAALMVEASGLPMLALGESRNLVPGQVVIAIGHPWGVLGAVTAGVVIGVGDAWSDGPLNGRELIATDLPLRPGNSGGPLLDAAGRLVGINAMVTGPNVSYAVPAHVAKAFLVETLGARPAAA